MADARIQKIADKAKAAHQKVQEKASEGKGVWHSVAKFLGLAPSHDGPEMLKNEIAALAGYAGAYDQWAADAGSAYGGGFDVDVNDSFMYGGCGCGSNPNAGQKGGIGKIGGADMDSVTVRDYGNSLNSKTKQRIFRDILDAAKRIGLTTTGEDEAAQIRSLTESIPHGSKFRKGDSAQLATCVGIAKAINEAHGSQVVDINLPGEVICQQIVEVLASLSAGMHVEFLSVYSDVQRVLKNLHVLKQLLSEAHTKAKDKIQASDDGILKREIADLEDVYKHIEDEIQRQIELLSNLLNIQLMPTAKDLAQILKHGKNFGFIEKIDPSYKPGQEGFGNVIHKVLQNMGVTAKFASVINQALKKVGMSMQDYAGTNSVEKLREKVVSGLSGKSLDEKDLHEYLSAAEFLYRNLYRAKDIEGISKSAAKSGGTIDLDTIGTDEIAMSGSFAGGSEYARSVMDKRVSDRKKVRDLIFNSFYRQINSLFDNFVGALDVLSMKVGSEIPLSDQLDGFRQLLTRVQQPLVRNKGIYFALIGYYNDALSRSKRDAFVGDLKMLGTFIDSMLELPMYKSAAGYFDAVRSAILAITSTIDKYSDEIAAKFGRGEGGDEHTAPQGCYAGASDDDLMEIAGGDVSGGADELVPSIPELKFKTPKGITDAVRQFDYKYRVAQIRQNMERSGKELSHYAEKYEKFTSTSIADILIKEKKQHDHLARLLENDKADVNRWEAGSYDKAKAMLKAQWEAKKLFWSTVEAIDAYMRVFTDGLVKNPADIKDIKAMLDDIEVISDWYSGDTGNLLAAVFDHFPAAIGNDVHVNKVPTKGTHYYDHVKTKLDEAAPATENRNPGRPEMVTTPAHGLNAREHVKKIFTTLGALKNLMSVFVHVGSKFGGEELRKKVFLTPAQIYNNLVEYIQASAFAQGYGVGSVPEADIDKTDATPANWNVTYGAASLPAGVPAGFIQGFAANAPGAANAAAPNDVEKAALALHNAKRHWGVWMRKLGQDKAEGFGFKMEDQYFVYMMKSIAAKIFTVTGMYDVMDRPYEFNGLSPIRMIIGGAEPTPKIEEGAVALYLRLPLMLQFYRELFGFDTNQPQWENAASLPMENNNGVKISMVPDIDGTFAGLIKLVFRKTKFVDPASYNDEDIKELIRECNVVFQKMVQKYPQNTVMETIHELVAEVNRRYGIVSRADRNLWEKEFGYRYDYSWHEGDRGEQTWYQEDNTASAEYPLLPGEEDEEIQRQSGALRLLSQRVPTSDETKKSKYTIAPDHKNLLYRFRCLIDKHFQNPSEEYTFNSAIKAAQMKLRRETRDEERFKIVSSLVRGTDIYSKVDGMKYVTFHETVVAGLNTLSAIHTMLSRFQRRVHLIDVDVLVGSLLNRLKTNDAALLAPTGNVPVNAGAGANAAQFTAFLDQLAETLGEIRVLGTADEIAPLLQKIFGVDENCTWNGGRSGNPDYTLKQVDGVTNSTTPRQVNVWNVISGVNIDALIASFGSRDKSGTNYENR